MLTALTTVFALTTVAHLSGDVCVYKPPRVRRICGIMVDSQGIAIPGVRVTVFKDVVPLKTSTTDQTGEFNFDTMEAGKYELDVEASGFMSGRYQLTLTRPTHSCKHSLRVEMEIGYPCRGGNIRGTKVRLGQAR